MEVSGLISQPFYIEKQESLVSDKFSKNGRTLDLHIVAKNIAFVVHIAAAFDLNLSPPSAKLIYDFDSVEDQREVEGLKNAPLEYTAHVDETGDHNKAAVEVKISVLSSQHEGAYFRIKFSAVDPVTHAVLEEYSQPIKVISKRNQVKRILEKKQPKLAGTENVSSTPIQAVVLSPSKRSSSDSNVAEILTKMEQQQREQLKLLEQLVSKKDVQPIKQQTPVPDPDDMDFETAFHKFLQAYTKIPQEERANKIRRVVKKSGENAVDNLAEFVGIYSGTSRNASGITPAEAFFLNNIDFLDGGCTDKSCKCQECPHKKELSRFDDFYHDFLAEPLSPNGSPEMV